MPTGDVAASPSEANIVVELCAAAYSIEAVHRAAYALMASVDVRIIAVDPAIICELRVLKSDLSPAAAELAFSREVTDQELRIVIEQKTESYRDLILGLTFSKTGLQGD